jgi:ABC-2 type transport system permease protein
MFRSQTELNFVSLFDSWDRHAINLYSTPLTSLEYTVAGIILSGARVLFGSTLLVLTAWAVFGFDLFTAGIVIPLAVGGLMITGWALAMAIRAAILVWGRQVEVLTWSVAILLQPISAVFYPLDVLPRALQLIGLCFPMAHIFESLRLVLSGDGVAYASLTFALVLAIVYLVAGFAVFKLAVRYVLRRGSLIRQLL